MSSLAARLRRGAVFGGGGTPLRPAAAPNYRGDPVGGHRNYLPGTVTAEFWTKSLRRKSSLPGGSFQATRRPAPVRLTQ
jgi:hypothetical protein